jgi:hypothetical protein
VSSGYEARLTANLTRQWRLLLNYSYTDALRTRLGNEMVAWYGLKPAPGSVRLVQGVRQDAAGRYVIDPSAYAPGGTIARWIELGARTPAANPSVLTTGTGGTTVAQEIFDFTETLSDTKQENEKRWGVRPHKASVFTAYDFKAGWLKGLTIGGGGYWRSANVIGADSAGREITGKEISSLDAMLAYSTTLERLRGRVRFQINVSNVLNRTAIIPGRIATGAGAPDGWLLPGGRGLAYSRYDLVAPRDVRFTTTFSF